MCNFIHDSILYYKYVLNFSTTVLQYYTHKTHKTHKQLRKDTTTLLCVTNNKKKGKCTSKQYSTSFILHVTKKNYTFPSKTLMGEGHGEEEVLVPSCFPIFVAVDAPRKFAKV